MTTSATGDKVRPILIDLVSPSPDKIACKRVVGARPCSKDRRIKNLETIISNLKTQLTQKVVKNQPKLNKIIGKLRNQIKFYEAKLNEIISAEDHSSTDSDLNELLSESEIDFETAIEEGLTDNDLLQIP